MSQPYNFDEWNHQDIVNVIDLLIDSFLDGDHFSDAGGVGVVAGLRIAKAYLPGDENPEADTAALAQMHVLASYSRWSIWYDHPDPTDETPSELRRNRQLKAALDIVSQVGRLFCVPLEALDYKDAHNLARLEAGELMVGLD